MTGPPSDRHRCVRPDRPPHRDRTRRRSCPPPRITGEQVHAPAHLDHEVSRAIVRNKQRKNITERQAGQAITYLAQSGAQRIPLPSLLPRAWELRDNTHVGDALYMALAEEPGCPLVTTDTKVAGVPGIRCVVETLAKT
ncbi:type II toxin-antitoxin system VapC family toxin [Streptomyces sp. NPDC049910]|uniref:type II toxin-antitoxin system VapC family toxin n=1 Tax=Streptomyces sp. NPDC049910 TaxID=3155278 RepID=UPI00343318D3